MQLCHIHFYQKIAPKKVARVNAALGRFSSTKQRFCWAHADSFLDFPLFAIEKLPNVWAQADSPKP